MHVCVCVCACVCKPPSFPRILTGFVANARAGMHARRDEAGDAKRDGDGGGGGGDSDGGRASKQEDACVHISSACARKHSPNTPPHKHWCDTPERTAPTRMMAVGRERDVKTEGIGGDQGMPNAATFMAASAPPDIPHGGIAQRRQDAGVGSWAMAEVGGQFLKLQHAGLVSPRTAGGVGDKERGAVRADAGSGEGGEGSRLRPDTRNGVGGHLAVPVGQHDHFHNSSLNDQPPAGCGDTGAGSRTGVATSAVGVGAGRGGLSVDGSSERAAEGSAQRVARGRVRVLKTVASVPAHTDIQTGEMRGTLGVVGVGVGGDGRSEVSGSSSSLPPSAVHHASDPFQEHRLKLTRDLHTLRSVRVHVRVHVGAFVFPRASHEQYCFVLATCVLLTNNRAHTLTHARVCLLARTQEVVRGETYRRAGVSGGEGKNPRTAPAVVRARLRRISDVRGSSSTTNKSELQETEAEGPEQQYVNV